MHFDFKEVVEAIRCCKTEQSSTVDKKILFGENEVA